MFHQLIIKEIFRSSLIPTPARPEKITRELQNSFEETLKTHNSTVSYKLHIISIKLSAINYNLHHSFTNTPKDNQLSELLDNGNHQNQKIQPKQDYSNKLENLKVLHKSLLS